MSDFPEEWNDITDNLSNFTLKKSCILTAGGGLSLISQWGNRAFKEKGWIKKSFNTLIEVDNNKIFSPTHSVDCVKGHIALEIEWNNKDPFFDQDPNNFRLLFDLGAISLGVIITKSNSLVPVIKNLGNNIWNNYGTSTTWMRKLLPRLEDGGGGGCPIIVFGITDRLFRENE